MEEVMVAMEMGDCDGDSWFRVVVMWAVLLEKTKPGDD